MAYIHTHNELDFRNLNAAKLKETDTQNKLKMCFDDYIWEGENQRSKEGIIDVMMRNDLYYEGLQTPYGFSSNALNEFVAKNKERLRLANTPGFVTADVDNQIYFSDNKIRDVIDGMIGEYTSVKKVVKTVSDNNPRNNRIEMGVKMLYDKYEKKNNIWHRVRIPCIEGMMKYGLYWSQTLFNPRKNIPIGNIDMKAIHPRFVIVDPVFPEKYFAASRYRIYKMKTEINEARRYLGRFGVKPEDVVISGDNYGSTTDNYFDERDMIHRTEYTYIYFVEHKRCYDEDYIKGSTMAEYGIEADDIMEERDYYFYSIYTPANGCVFHGINKNTFSNDDYDKFYLTPYYNKFSAVRTHPQSDVEGLCNIQDLINITKTLILDNARQKNIVRLFVKQKLRDTYGDLLDKFLRFGGTLEIEEEDDIRKAIHYHDIPSLPKEVYEFLEIAENSMKDQSYQKEAMKGEYPKDVMSGKAINLLQQQNRRILNYKDININWAATQEAQKMYNVFANEFSEEDYVNITEQTSPTSKVIPINAIKSYPEYVEFLEENQINQDKFEEENEVEIAYKGDDQYLGAMPKEQVMANTLVFINHLSPDDNVSMSVTLDFDAERDESEDRAIAIELFTQGKYPFSMLLDALGGSFAANKDEILQKLDEENLTDMAKAYSVEIEKRGPEFIGELRNLMAQYDAMKGKAGQTQQTGQTQAA